MKKKILIVILVVIFAVILSLVIPVKKEISYQYGNGSFDVSNPMNGDYTVYTYKNIYGITIKTTQEMGITIYN